jgi:C4-dicarboxylate transporter, DctM subunit
MITVLLLSFGVMVVVGTPIWIAMAGSAMLAISMEGIPLTVAAQRIVAGTQSFPLLAIPLFTLAGSLMNASGISERLFGFTKALVGHIRGGPAHTLVVGEIFLSGISGSSVADTAAASRVVVPQLERMGYPRAFGAALSAVAGTLGPIIPPSILMVVYAWQANISLGKLFVAGILPGLVMAGCIMATIAILAWRRDFRPAQAFSLAVLWREFKHASLALLMPVLIIVGFRAGLFTATEIAGVAALYALIVGMGVYRSIRIVDLPAILIGTARETAVILAIVAAASPFSWILAVEQAPQLVTGTMSSISTDPLVVLLVLNIALLIAGMFMETIAIMIILVPILLPLLTSLQVDLVHFGIVLLVNLVIGQVTPPVGVLCFVAMAITRVRLGPLLAELWPFLIALIVALAIITYLPGLSLWLPYVAGF